MKIWYLYGKASGQLVNLQKSSITFGANIKPEMQQKIKAITGISEEGGAGSYLGLPECFSGSKTEMLAFIYDRLKERMSGWFVRLLSQGGKEILLKAVAMALPVYAMSCFKLTKKSCDLLTQAMADFWWNALDHKKKIHWLSWSTLCLAKDQGGLGFKDIQNFNQALLAKQTWRILNHPLSLFARVFKSRYFDDNDILNAKVGKRPSYAWRSLLFGRELLLTGLRKEVGNGLSSLVWVDEWVFDGQMRRPLMMNPLVDFCLPVNSLIDFQNRDWNHELLGQLFYPQDINLITARKPVVDHEDFWIWLHNKSGSYSVKSGYWLANRTKKAKEIVEAEQRPSLNPLKESVWSIKTEPKIRAFLWKVLNGAIPVTECLSRRGIKMDLRCQACGSEIEAINHVLFLCPVARQVWALSGIPHPRGGFCENSVYANYNTLLNMSKLISLPVQSRSLFAWVLWYLWKNRNSLLFDGRKFDAMEVVVKIKEEVELWFLAQELDVSQAALAVASESTIKKRWEPPCRAWFKCNIAVCGKKNNRIGGGSWVLRNENGCVLLHSRKAFFDAKDEAELSFRVILWTFESMVSHRMNRVIFCSEDISLIGAVTRPIAWPSFRFQGSEMLNRLRNIEWWRLECAERVTNRGAFLIAQSVCLEGRVQSYVARSYPSWLKDLFENEKPFPSL